MLKKLIEESCGKISDSALREILDLTTTDIKVNRIGYHQRTRIDEVVGIAEICHSIVLR